MKSFECVKAAKVSHKVQNYEVEDFIVYLKIVESSYLSLEDINEWDAMFPFEYKMTREMIALDNRYQITAFDGKTV